VPGAARPSVDLVVATAGRTDELGRLLGSLEEQTRPPERVLVVDQNDDDRVAGILASHPSLPVERLRSPRGLSRARNAALPLLRADLVAFPDDDCRYPADLLERVTARFEEETGLGVVCGRLQDEDGRAAGRFGTKRRRVGDDDVWHAGTSATIFARREVVAQVGEFDEALGLGPDARFGSGEEIDYLVRALRAGVEVEYDPALVVLHPVRPTSRDELVALGRRDGGSVGYVLARHGYPPRAVARMLVRPAVGSLVSLVLLDPTRARFHAATLAGRVCGLRYGRSRGGSAN
jgi:GT2 family glycosyltransferase